MFPQFLHRSLHRLSKSARRERSRESIKRRFSLESLESRELMAVTSLGGSSSSSIVRAPIFQGPAQQIASYGISLSNTGALSIQGDGSDNRAVVDLSNNKVEVDLMHWGWSYDANCNCQVPLPSQMVHAEYDLSQVNVIKFYGMSGDDEFVNRTSIPSIAYGHSGDDWLVGGNGRDTLYGGAGADTLEGRGGDGFLHGELGDDNYLFAGVNVATNYVFESTNAGVDTLDFSELGPENPAVGAAGVRVDLLQTGVQYVHSHQGQMLKLILSTSADVENVIGSRYDDVIRGNGRANLLRGGDGHDELFGLAGDDTLYGDDGDDELYPGTGANDVWDGAGNDLVDFRQNSAGVTFHASHGDDVIHGTSFDDFIWGSYGDDTIFGYGGHDVLSGESENDELHGATGNDILAGGAGHDELYAGMGFNSVTDGPGNDHVDLSQNYAAINYTTGGGHDTVLGTIYDDVITGSSGNNRLEGRNGNDRLFGLGGVDELYGGSGNDWLEAGSAGEVAEGGAGTDYNAHVWAVNGTSPGDVSQQQSPTCVFLSSLASAADQGVNLAGRINYLGNYKYRVMLYNPDTEAADYEDVHFDGALAMTPFGDQWDPQPMAGEFWTVLYQRAFLQMMKTLDENYKDADNTLYSLTGRDVWSPILDDPSVVANALGAGSLVIAGNADETELFVDRHSYTVLDVSQHGGTWFVMLRNPWGVDGDEDMQFYGDPNDGIIVVTWDDFIGYYDFDRISIS